MSSITEEDSKYLDELMANMEPLALKVEGMVASAASAARQAVIESAIPPVKTMAVLPRITPG